MVLALCGVQAGALYLQLASHEDPCPYCLLQRLGMTGVAVGGLLNLRLGPDPRHYGLSLLAALAGGAVAVHQTGVQAVLGEGSGPVVLGLRLPTWSLLVFLCSAAGVGLLLLVSPAAGTGAVRGGRSAAWVLGVLLVLLTAANAVTTAQKCGLELCWH
jgi:disulfide bond formation protein DsbB